MWKLLMARGMRARRRTTTRGAQRERDARLPGADGGGEEQPGAVDRGVRGIHKCHKPKAAIGPPGSGEPADQHERAGEARREAQGKSVGQPQHCETFALRRRADEHRRIQYQLELAFLRHPDPLSEEQRQHRDRSESEQPGGDCRNEREAQHVASRRSPSCGQLAGDVGADCLVSWCIQQAADEAGQADEQREYAIQLQTEHPRRKRHAHRAG